MKARLLKITLSFAMLFIAAGAFAQTLEDPYSNYNMPSFTSATNTTEDTLTITTRIPYYVDPDDVINSLSGSYDTTSTNADQGIVTSFSWSINQQSGTSSPGLDYLPAGTSSEDTAAFVWLTAGNTPTGSSNDADTLEVYEYKPGVGCPGPVRQVPVRVVDTPSFDVSSNSVVDTVEVCNNATVTLTLNTVANNGIEPYGTVDFLMDTSVANVSGNDYSNVTTSIESATDHVKTRQESNALTGGNFDLFTRTLTVENSDVTRYTYTFRGMNDHISRKSDFHNIDHSTANSDTDFSFYGPSDTDDAVVYVVFPTPQTGDVYYVPNDFDL